MKFNKTPTHIHHNTINCYFYHESTYIGQHFLEVAPEWCLHCLSKNRNRVYECSKFDICGQNSQIHALHTSTYQIRAADILWCVHITKYRYQIKESSQKNTTGHQTFCRIAIVPQMLCLDIEWW
jgi:hypothetical protein